MSMIDFLNNSMQSTNFRIALKSTDIENLYRDKLNTYIKEIPPNFLSFYNKRNKREKVEKHLKNLYSDTTVSSSAVECVLKRVINLARVANSLHRS
ncbi:MAG: hypothetical protein WBF48_11340, partial [Halarcobacter sp.]